MAASDTIEDVQEQFVSADESTFDTLVATLTTEAATLEADLIAATASADVLRSADVFVAGVTRAQEVAESYRALAQSGLKPEFLDQEQRKVERLLTTLATVAAYLEAALP